MDAQISDGSVIRSVKYGRVKKKSNVSTLAMTAATDGPHPKVVAATTTGNTKMSVRSGTATTL